MARDEKVDLIVMSTHGHGVLYRFLLGSVAAKVLHESDCPVWTTPHLEETPAREFVIRNILCAVDLSPHSRNTVSRAAQMAAEFGAGLTLVHITAGIETYGPGGSHVDPRGRKRSSASPRRRSPLLQRSVGTKAEVIIESGNALDLLNQSGKRNEGRSPGHRAYAFRRSFGGQRQWLCDHSRIAHPGAERLRNPKECSQRIYRRCVGWTCSTTIHLF